MSDSDTISTSDSQSSSPGHDSTNSNPKNNNIELLMSELQHSIMRESGHRPTEPLVHSMETTFIQPHELEEWNEKVERIQKLEEGVSIILSNATPTLKYQIRVLRDRLNKNQITQDVFFERVVSLAEESERDLIEDADTYGYGSLIDSLMSELKTSPIIEGFMKKYLADMTTDEERANMVIDDMSLFPIVAKIIELVELEKANRRELEKHSLSLGVVHDLTGDEIKIESDNGVDSPHHDLDFYMDLRQSAFGQAITLEGPSDVSRDADEEYERIENQSTEKKRLVKEIGHLEQSLMVTEKNLENARGEVKVYESIRNDLAKKLQFANDTLVKMTNVQKPKRTRVAKEVSKKKTKIEDQK